MKLYLVGHDFRYAVEQTLLTLFPGERPEYPAGEPDGTPPAARITLAGEGERLLATAELWWGDGPATAFCSADRAELTGGYEDGRIKRRIVQLAFYRAAVAALGREPPWGALTGVRPVKLPTKWMLEGMSREGAKKRLTELYRVSESRAELAMECAGVAVRIRRSLPEGSAALYVGIPFCPTRCAYCSFISADVRGALKLVEPYVDALCREIETEGRRLREQGIQLTAAYMGGGTPTTLTAEQLDRVLTAMKAHLPLEYCTEFTVEAGRPDTITADKLAALRRHGVHRISVNPQSMEDHVLRAVGRAHTAAQIEESMALARKHFGGLVNMDLIAGLPSDSVAGFTRTLDKVLAMAPENITVHTLALKKGARLFENAGGLCPPETVAGMLELANDRLREAGYLPYYLYRQKYMSGSFENVGWAKPGCECIYNVIMMEELQSVLSLGAGGVTRLVDAGTGHIERVCHPKYPGEYLEAAP